MPKLTKKIFFLPDCQGESSESKQQPQPRRKCKSFLTGALMFVCLCILTWSLGRIFVNRDESECTRSNCGSELFFLTQHDDDTSPAINDCISVWKLQGRSNGATAPFRARGIRQAMAAPSTVRVRMISCTILRHKLRGMINPVHNLMNTNFMQNV